MTKLIKYADKKNCKNRCKIGARSKRYIYILEKKGIKGTMANIDLSICLSIYLFIYLVL